MSTTHSTTSFISSLSCHQHYHQLLLKKKRRRRNVFIVVLAVYLTVLVVLFLVVNELGARVGLRKENQNQQYRPGLCLSSPATCEELMEEVVVQLCTAYRSGLFTGELCPKFCGNKKGEGVSLLPTSCPGFAAHSGKEVVLEVKNMTKTSSSNSSSSVIILKSSALMIEELTGKGSSELLQSSSATTFLTTAILDLVSDHLGSENQYLSNNNNQSDPSYLLFQYSNSKFLPSNFSNLSQIELLNAWLLFLDNEYLLSNFRTSADHRRLFPPVLGTCGHFYAVQRVHPVLDFGYFLPTTTTSSAPSRSFYHQLLSGSYFSSERKIKIRSSNERLQLALDLLDFLRRFRHSKPKLELCDLKYSHFGYLEEAPETEEDNINHSSHFHRHLVLLDSDLIYPLSTVNRSIVNSVNSSCTSDEDCHFFDCQGECQLSTGSCRLNSSDTDLRQLCRNLFFMGHKGGKENEKEEWIDFGLLASLDDAGDEGGEVEQLKKICFDAVPQQKNSDSDLDSMEAIIRRMLAR